MPIHYSSQSDSVACSCFFWQVSMWVSSPWGMRTKFCLRSILGSIQHGSFNLIKEYSCRSYRVGRTCAQLYFLPPLFMGLLNAGAPCGLGSDLVPSMQHSKFEVFIDMFRPCPATWQDTDTLFNIRSFPEDFCNVGNKSIGIF